MLGSTLTLEGINYIVLRERKFFHGEKERTCFFLRRVGGKKIYEVIRYEDGSFSRVV